MIRAAFSRRAGPAFAAAVIAAALAVQSPVPDGPAAASGLLLLLVAGDDGRPCAFKGVRE